MSGRSTSDDTAVRNLRSIAQAAPQSDRALAGHRHPPDHAPVPGADPPSRRVARATHGPVAWRAGPVETITASDPLTVRYQLKKPYGELLAQLSLFFTTIVDRHAVETLGRDFGVRGFNGTGPYCWGGWQPRQELVLHRHQGYDLSLIPL